MERGQSARGSDFKDCARILRSAGKGGAIEIAVRRLQQCRVRVKAVGAVRQGTELIQQVIGAVRTDLKDRAGGGVLAVPGCPAVSCRPVEITVEALNQSGDGTSAIAPVKTVQYGMGLGLRHRHGEDQ